MPNFKRSWPFLVVKSRLINNFANGMGIKSFLAKPFAKWQIKKNQKWINNPVATQQKVFQELINSAKNTAFGKDHNFSSIKSYEDFKKQVPVQDYEGLRPYVDRIVAGESDVLWKGKPIYFAKTSGTTSGEKYIPITKESIPTHIKSAKDCLLNYVVESGDASFVDGKMIFLQGSPTLEKKNGIDLGRLSGIVAHHVPNYLQKNRMPSFKTNCIEDWETKVDAIVEETLKEDMTLISGIPPWVQMYFDKIQEQTGKKIKEVFPNFKLFVHGGVNFQPYKSKLFESIGEEIPNIETYPSSEGFIAYQDSQKSNDLLLLLDNGMFYEFIPVEEFHNENPSRLSIGEVEVGKNYAIVLNTNAGLWGYLIGDTVEFTSIKPYKIRVTGRIKHFISAFGEHVIGSEVEKAMNYALKNQPKTEVVEFTVAPQVNPEEGLPYHEWLISFAEKPKNIEKFKSDLDYKLQELNSYYKDLIVGSVLTNLKIAALPEDAFIRYMKSKGKLGGQNKVPRLSNNREIADDLIKFAS